MEFFSVKVPLELWENHSMHDTGQAIILAFNKKSWWRGNTIMINNQVYTTHILHEGKNQTPCCKETHVYRWS